MLKGIKNRFSKKIKNKEINPQPITDETQDKVHRKIEKNLQQLKGVLGRSDDIVFRDFEIPSMKHTRVFICYVKGMVNLDRINQHIVKALMHDSTISDCNENSLPNNIYKTVKNNMLTISDLKETQSMKEVISAILSGNTALFINKSDSALIINTKDYKSRNVEEPSTENVVRGPHEGFTENLFVNVALIRRRIKNPNLIIEKMTIGKQTNTSVFIAYLDNIANPQIVGKVKKRLNRIETDSILESGYIEQFIEDNPKSIFPTIGNSEKPDVVVAKMLEGKVAILCDGTPFILTVPLLFIENLKSSEDYAIGPYIASFIRMLRILSLFITLATPALYVAITTFHHEMIPAVLLITMAASREGVPFPSSIEAIVMILIFEILREAGVRMPKPVGQAISIVGALVLGEAAVAAGVVSSPMIIVVGITGITGFVNPPLTNISILLRIILILLATWLGLYGVLIGFFFILAHMCSLYSFGVPYLAPIAPTIWRELKDSFIISFLRSKNSRPESITWKYSQNQSTEHRPEPPTRSSRGGEE